MKFKYLFGIVLIFSLVLIMNNIYAVEVADIPFELKIINSESDITDRFIFEMIPENKENPMPNGTEDGVYKFTVDGEGTHKLNEISFEVPGDYVYYVYQIEGENPQYRYDDSYYALVISVVNSIDYTGLETHVTITKDDMEEKYDSLYFENEYFSPMIDLPDTSDINVCLYISIIGTSLIAIYLTKKIINE